MTGARPRILILNQYYWPGVEATAQLLAELSEALAEEFDVTVATAVLHQQEHQPRRLERNGVRIVRVPSTSYERTHLWRRGINYVTYLASALASSLTGPRPELVICMTDPPVVGDVGLAVARRFRAPLLVISEDVFPEIAVELRRIENPLLVSALSGLVRLYLRRADRIVAIGETMRRRLIAKGAPAERIEVIPNWVDTRALTPQPRDNAWSREQGLADRFVVMHSGNLGHAQGLETLVRAATFLRDLDDLEIVLVGFGARSASLVALAERLEADNVRFLPYQPREVLPLSLSSAHVHFVGLAPGLSGYVVPSRLYSVLSVARPALVAADADSETAQVVEQVGCGVVVPPGRPELVAAAIRDLHAQRDDLAEMGLRGRRYAENEADREVALERYRKLIRELLGSAASVAA